MQKIITKHMINKIQILMVVFFCFVIIGCVNRKIQAHYSYKSCSLQFADTLFIYDLEFSQASLNSQLNFKPKEQELIAIKTLYICSIDTAYFTATRMELYRKLDLTRNFTLLLGVRSLEGKQELYQKYKYTFVEGLPDSDKELIFILTRP
jgi:hypothetical protein